MSGLGSYKHHKVFIMILHYGNMNNIVPVYVHENVIKININNMEKNKPYHIKYKGEELVFRKLDDYRVSISEVIMEGK